MQKLNRLYNLIINESTIDGIDYVNEVDWEGDFSDVKPNCISPKDVVDYLNRIIANGPKKTADREKFGAKQPYVHSKSTLFQKGETEVDIQDFITKITTAPKTIIGKNDKIAKSGGRNEFVVNTGIPALRGIIYDIEKQDFHYVNTCPGAGECAIICYARKGNYIRYSQSYDNMTRRLNYLMNYPDKYQQQMYNELKVACKEYNAVEGYRSKVIVRWNDSGDFFTKKYVKIAEDVINQLRTDGYNIESYAYTKVADVANDNEFDNSKFSSGGNKRQTSKADKSKGQAKIIPMTLFNDLDLQKISDIEEFKNRVAKAFKLDINTLLTYDELLDTPKSNERKWTVIVISGDGDDAAFRPDVKDILLAQH